MSKRRRGGVIKGRRGGVRVVVGKGRSRGSGR